MHQLLSVLKTIKSTYPDLNRVKHSHQQFRGPVLVKIIHFLGGIKYYSNG